MKTYSTIVLAISFMICGCKHGWNTDISEDPLYSQLFIETEWKLKDDAYIVEFGDHRGHYIISPCKSPFWVTFPPDWKKEYNENNIPRKDSHPEVVGGLRAGETIVIVRVVKNSHIKMGESYHPMVIPKKENRWTGKKELDGKALYRYSDDKTMLDTNYVERIE